MSWEYVEPNMVELLDVILILNSCTVSVFISDRRADEQVPSEIGLPGPATWPLPRDDLAPLEDLAAPYAPGLGPLDRAGEALNPDRAIRAQGLRELKLGRSVREPQVRVEPPAGNVLKPDHRDGGSWCQSHHCVTSFSRLAAARGVARGMERGCFEKHPNLLFCGRTVRKMRKAADPSYGFRGLEVSQLVSC
jgi:hypothetical protein